MLTAGSFSNHQTYFKKYHQNYAKQKNESQFIVSGNKERFSVPGQVVQLPEEETIEGNNIYILNFEVSKG